MNAIVDSGYQGYFTFESCNFPIPSGGWPYRRKNFDEDTRLLEPSLDIKLMAENLLYETGKYILQQYGIFEN